MDDDEINVIRNFFINQNPEDYIKTTIDDYTKLTFQIGRLLYALAWGVNLTVD